MHSILQKMLCSAAIFALFVCLGGRESAAQDAGFGIRAGASVSPDQFIFGGQFQTGPLVPHLAFRPNLEFGVGSHVTTVAFNFEFAYFIPVQNHLMDIYLGAGPALLIYHHSGNQGRGDGGGTNANGGFNLLAGIQHQSGLFGEIKGGLIDSPTFKITIGYAFR